MDTIYREQQQLHVSREEDNINDSYAVRRGEGGVNRMPYLSFTELEGVHVHQKPFKLDTCETEENGCEVS